MVDNFRQGMHTSRVQIIRTYRFRTGDQEPMLSELLYVHPAGQALVLLIGLVNLYGGLRSGGVNRDLHLNAGILFYVTGIIGAGVGVLVARVAGHEGVVLDLGMHRHTGMVLLVLISMGATTGFLLMRQISLPLARCHRWLNVSCCALFCLQLATGIRQLAGLA